VSASDLEFRIFKDVKHGFYRWRLISTRGETVDYSQPGHCHKGNCEQEVQHLRNDKYPGARVRDLSVNRSES
jgi:uncharacterized protein YegP (UPF0339 family)